MIYVEWYPEHDVTDPKERHANQEWAEKVYHALTDGGIVGTSHGMYVKRDGGLYRHRGAERWNTLERD